MIRVVADTNTLVSGFGWRGPPAAVVDAVLAGHLTLITSPPLLDELTRVLRYPKLAGVFPDPDAIVNLIGTVAETVHPSTRLAVVTDEPDNRVLEAAATGRADAIVTGDAGRPTRRARLPRNPAPYHRRTPDPPCRPVITGPQLTMTWCCFSWRWATGHPIDSIEVDSPAPPKAAPYRKFRRKLRR